MAVYEVGDRISLAAEFLDDNDVPTNPDTVTLRVERPGFGVPVEEIPSTDPRIVNPAPGLYDLHWTIDAEGSHQYAYVGVGVVQRTVTGSFNARRFIPE